MADVKISEMAQDGTVGGSEKIPVSDAGSPKHVTVDQVKNYVIDSIEAVTAGTAVTGSDGVFALQSGVLKPVDIDLVAQHAIDTIWGKATEATPDDADVLPLKDGGVTEKTVTLANLKSYITTALQTTLMDISTLGAAGAVSSAHLYLISQGGVAKKITHTDLLAAIFAGLEDYVSAKTAATAVSSADLTYLIQSGVDKKVTIELITAAVLAGFDSYTTALSAVSSSQATDVFYVLQGGTEKKATLTQVTAAILAAMDTYVAALSAGSTPVAADVFYTLQSSVEKKVTTAQLSSAILGDFVTHVTTCSAATTVGGTDTLYLIQGSTGKKVAFSVIVTSIFAGLEAYVNALGAATLNTTDVFYVLQGTSEKKTTLSAITTKIYDGLLAHVTGKDAIVSTADADIFYTIQGGVAKKVTLAQIVAHAGALVSGSGTATTLAKWSSTSVLESGPTITESGDGFTTGTNLTLPTTAAVRGEMDAIVNDATDIGVALADTDNILVYDASAVGQRKSAVSRIWTYVITAIQALAAKTTPVDADILMIQDSEASSVLKELTVGNLWDNRYLTDAKAIKIDDLTAGDDNTDLNATTVKHGLCPKLGSGTTNYLRADGSWAEPPGSAGWDGDIADINIDGGTDIGAGLADADLVVVDDGGAGTNRKSAISRMWTYIWSKVSGATPKTTPVDGDGIGIVDSEASSVVKLLTFANMWTNYLAGKVTTAITGTKIDDLTAGDDNTDLNTTIVKHGLCPKLGGGTANFLRADGGWAEPPGTAGGWDGDITDINIDGGSDIGFDLEDADLIVVDDGAGGTNRKSAISRVWTYISGKLAAFKLDDLATPDDNTDLNANTTNHGLLLKATAPAAGIVNVVGIANGETAYTNKALLDDTNPANLGTVGPGTAVTAARRDHIHANPAIDTLAAATDITTLNATTSAHGLVVQATAPAAGIVNFVGIANAETAYTNKALLDDTNPANLGTAGPGTATVAARRDHVHANPALDTLAATTDITTLDATTGAHGLMPKADKVKLDGIATAADVTGAVNVAAAGAVMDGDFTANGMMMRTGSGTYTTILHKFNATSAPTVDDDVDLGYSIGSLWINTTSDKTYCCVDATNGAAVWFDLTQPAAGWDGDINDMNISGTGTEISAALEDADLFVLYDNNPGAIRKTLASRVKTYCQGIKLDALTAPDVGTTLDATTSKHGLVVQATAPAVGIVNFIGIANAETAYTNKALLDDTNPAGLGSVGPGTATVAARRDHIHANPAIDTLAAATDITTRDATTTAHGLVVRATAPGAGLVNVVGIGNGETAYTMKTMLDDTAPAAIGTAAAGTAVTAARRDHVHALTTLANNLNGNGYKISTTVTAGNSIEGMALDGYGVYGYSTNSSGVFGTSPNGAGVEGSSADGYGVAGSSVDGYGVAGASTNGIGIEGYSENSLSGRFYKNLGIYAVINSANKTFTFLLDDSDDYMHFQREAGILGLKVDMDKLQVGDGTSGAQTFVMRATANATFTWQNDILKVDKLLETTVTAAMTTDLQYITKGFGDATYTDGTIADLNIDGGTDIGAALADVDLIVVDDGAGGTNRKCAMSRVKTYIDTIGTYDEIYVDAGAMVGCTTAGAASGTKEYGTNDVDMDYFAFDGGATEERVQFKLVMPPSWDRDTIKVKFFWTSATGSTAGDTVEWGIKAGALSNDDAIDAALGTAVTVSDVLLANSGGDLQVTAATAAVTVGGTPALGDMVAFEVYRNTDGTDDMTEDAWLLGVQIQYKKTNAVSAW